MKIILFILFVVMLALAFYLGVLISKAPEGKRAERRIGISSLVLIFLAFIANANWSWDENFLAVFLTMVLGLFIGLLVKLFSNLMEVFKAILKPFEDCLKSITRHR